jgi:predicted dinucleotide-utilizing enzyme
MINQELKEELENKLEQLPASKLQEVLDFASFLLSQQSHEDFSSYNSKPLKADEDPLLNFIGAVSHGRLAEDIDDEVYDL